MGIGKKLLISNSIMVLVMMLMLSGVAAVVINSYVIRDVEKELWTSNNELLEYLQILNKKGEINLEEGRVIMPLEYFEKERRMQTFHLIVFNGQSEGVYFVPSRTLNRINDATINELMAMEEQSFQRYNLFQQPSYVFKNTLLIDVEGQEQIFTIVSVISTDVYTTLMGQLLGPLLIVFVVVMLMTLLITMVLSRQFTRPINILMDMTERTANGKSVYDDEIITGDEFEALGNSFYDMTEALKKKERAQKDFYEQVSHDFKTPLTVISGYAEGIDGGIFKEEDEPLKGIIKECSNLKQQIEDVIYLSQLESRQLSIEMEEAEVTEVVTKCLNRYEFLALLRDIDLSFEPGEPIYLQTDSKQLSRALDNIMTNCLKHAAHRISVALILDAQDVVLRFQDDGNGFNEDVLKELGQGVYKATESNGIGLMIIQNIVHMLGGQIVMGNAAEGGALYNIRLPLGDKNIRTVATVQYGRLI